MKMLADLLGLAAGDIVSIIGCGGKTSLLWGLAKHYRHERVLVSTTTKIGRPPSSFYDNLIDATQLEKLMRPEKIKPGIYLSGTLNVVKDHVKSLTLPALESISKNFDKILLEADGSRTLPVKGWAKHEPVVPGFSSVTIGLVTISAEGRTLNEDTVHRPDLFCSISGAQPNKPISLEHLAAATVHPAGLMSRACGRKILLINQLDSTTELERAKTFISFLPKHFQRDLNMIIGASIAQGKAIEMLRNNLD